MNGKATLLKGSQKRHRKQHKTKLSLGSACLACFSSFRCSLFFFSLFFSLFSSHPASFAHTYTKFSSFQVSLAPNGSGRANQIRPKSEKLESRTRASVAEWVQFARASRAAEEELRRPLGEPNLEYNNDDKSPERTSPLLAFWPSTRVGAN